MQYRKKTIIFVSITTAVILLLLLGGGLLWYMPHFWLDKLQNEYLLHNRNMLRVKNIQAGAFNKYILSDIQIGDNQKPLISAPYAELQLENRWEKFFTALPIKKLIIYDCKVKIESSKRKVYINGVLLEKFVKHSYESELPAMVEHYRNGADHRKYTRYERAEALRYGVRDVLDIVRHTAHNVTVRMRIEVFYRKIIYLTEQIVPHQLYDKLT